MLDFNAIFFLTREIQIFCSTRQPIFRRRSRNRILRTARNRMPTPKSCSESCKEQLCHYVVRRFVEWLASICLSNTPGRFVVANFTSFRLTKSILLEMAVYNMQFKLVLMTKSDQTSVRCTTVLGQQKELRAIIHPCILILFMERFRCIIIQSSGRTVCCMYEHQPASHLLLPTPLQLHPNRHRLKYYLRGSLFAQLIPIITL